MNDDQSIHVSNTRFLCTVTPLVVLEMQMMSVKDTGFYSILYLQWKLVKYESELTDIAVINCHNVTTTFFFFFLN